MSDNTCTIEVSTGAAEFLYSIVDTTPAKDKKDSNKMAALFRAMRPAIDDATARRQALENEYVKEEEVDDGTGKGTKTPVKRVPEAKNEEYKKKVDAVIAEKVQITFDRESFVYLKQMMDKIFELNPNLKSGLTGSLHIRLHDEVVTAIDSFQMPGKKK